MLLDLSFEIEARRRRSIRQYKEKKYCLVKASEAEQKNAFCVQ
jgi:hypothetical protein